ncbi:MAG: hypothetical protein LBG83_09280 [Oscillospiraceae bacterium]|jgi:hypothetical protein|nr:hypothetical protein [Oscillospiraceae bacterium]
MLALDVIRDGRSVSLELPVPIDILCGELRNIGVYEPLHNIQRTEFLLQPTNELGEHFMKLVQPDDSLQAIALACLEPTVLAMEPRRELEALLRNDSFRDIDQMNDYLRYGPAALDRFIRLNLDGRTLGLPCSYLPEKLGCSPQEMRLIDTDYAPLNEQGKALLCELILFRN